MQLIGRFSAFLLTCAALAVLLASCRDDVTTETADDGRLAVAIAQPAEVEEALLPLVDGQPAAERLVTDEQRAAAVGRLAMLSDAQYLPVLRASVTYGHPLVRRNAIYGLQRLNDLASVPAIAGLALGDEDPAVRRTAVVALGRLKHPESAAALSQALKDEDVLVRGDALLALGRLGDPTTQAAIVEALKNRQLWLELDLWTQVPILRMLALPFFEDRNVIPVLHELMASRDWDRRQLREVTPEVRHARALLIAHAAADVLAVKFGDSAGEDLLIEGLSRDDYMQQRSAYALGCIRSRKAVPALLAMLQKTEWTTNKLYAIEALAQSAKFKLPASADPQEARAWAEQRESVHKELSSILRGPHFRLAQAASNALLEMRVAVPFEGFAVPERAQVPEQGDGPPVAPGGKRPPLFIVLGVDDCVNVDGLEAMLDIVETLAEHDVKVNYTLWVAPLAGDPTTRDLQKQVLLLQRLFDTGSEIANHTLHHNPGGRFWTSLPKEQQVEEIEGAAQWYRDHIAGFTRPFTYKGGGGASGTAVDMDYSRQLLARQNFVYRGRRLRHPNDFAWPAKDGPNYTIGVGPMDGTVMDAAGRRPNGEMLEPMIAGQVSATIVDGFHSDYSGSFHYNMEDGLAMYRANFEYRYNHPLRPPMAINAFHDWGFQFYGNHSHRNQAALLKAFLLDVLVHNRDKYPDVYCVTFKQLVEYVASEGDLEHTLAVGNSQDSRNPVKPLVE